MAKKRTRHDTSEPALGEYRRKRDFGRTPEPRGDGDDTREPGRLFVVQKHAARQLHYDLRLEMDGVLKSWAVPKGPCLDHTHKPLAVHVEDHPMEYGDFEGIIPAGEYGGGTVMLWDRGTWEPIGDPEEGYEKGDLKFRLHGEKLGGAWVLARMGGRAGEDGKNWLLIKKKDDAARPVESYNVLGERPHSVASGRTMEEIAADPEAVWRDGAAQPTGAKSARRPRPAPALPDPADLDGARAADCPDVLAPQLCTSVRRAPEGDDWLHEIKLDGYRLLARLHAGDVRLFTRNGHDWTERFPNVARALADVPLADAFLDGEVVVLDETGVSDFNALQGALKKPARAAFTMFVFDVPYADGHDLRRVPLIERKAYLEEVLAAASSAAPVVQFCEHFEGRGPVVFDQARRAGLEGIISKHAHAPYESRRTETWVKVKCVHRQEFVVGGYTHPKRSSSGVGALLLGVHDDDGEGLVYCGRVGTGFRASDLARLETMLVERHRSDAPFRNPEADPEPGAATWVDPDLVVEVEFGHWTKADMVRHATYRGLREDRSPREVRREPGGPRRASRGREARHVVRAPRSPDDAYVEGTRISHPNRTVYPEVGVTKREVAEYYVAIADWILPRVSGRPLSLVRCPLGMAGEAFYQRRVGEGFPKSIRPFIYEHDGAEDDAILIRDRAGLLELVQMGTLEIHAWNCRADRADRPDQFVLDLDPGPGITWPDVVESARVIRDYVRDLGLEPFVKTTGGAGVHLVVPIVRRRTWDEVVAFTRGIARNLQRMAPLNFVATVSKALRENRIYVDFLRNTRGATAVAAYSTRARDAATVSTPLRWSELSPKLRPADLNVRTVPKRIARLKSDPWEGFEDARTAITAAMERAVGR
ncbi:MAG: DNA ligase D [Planctomycetota bacterium]|jgi:bifunctional non-homologous end joining protein LigD